MLVRYDQHFSFKLMADSHLNRDESEIQSFIVRIWHETVDDNGKFTHLRGVVEQVGSDQRVYFQDLHKIIAFIQKQLGIQAGFATYKRTSWAARLRYVFRKRTNKRT